MRMVSAEQRQLVGADKSLDKEWSTPQMVFEPLSDRNVLIFSEEDIVLKVIELDCGEKDYDSPCIFWTLSRLRTRSPQGVHETG